MKALLLIFVICMDVAVDAQIPAGVEHQLEQAAEWEQEDLRDDDTYLQQLEFFRRHPINLNTADAEDLRLLQTLNDLQIASIIRYRERLGMFVDIYELQAVPLIDLSVIRKILSFVFAGPALPPGKDILSRFSGGEHLITARWSRVAELSRGYKRSSGTLYHGDPNQLLLRYKYANPGHLQFGFVAEKDAGEQFFRGAQKRGFDFYSAHFFIKKLGRIKALVIGDFTTNLGQGLIQWQSMGFGKTVEVLSIKKQSPVLMPYNSIGEFYFNRGAGLTYQKGSIEATAFISAKAFSGNYVRDSIEYFSAFHTSGLYRTNAEAAERYNLNDLSFGGNFSWAGHGFRIGINSVTHHFSLPLRKRAVAYTYFAPAGAVLSYASVDYSYTYRNMHVFGEAAIDKKLSSAFLHGVLLSVDPNADLAFVYRGISKKYQALFAKAFTESSVPSDETGIYAGLILRPVSRWQFSAYADLYRFPFLKYRIDAPAAGKDYLLQLIFQPSRNKTLYIRYRNEDKPSNISDAGLTLLFPVSKSREGLRVGYSADAGQGLSLKTRLEWICYDRTGPGAEEGFLLYMEGTYKPMPGLKTTLRFQYFETGGYNSRIYAYQPDVFFAAASGTFFDKGLKSLAVIHYNFNRWGSLGVSLGRLFYPGQSTIGSGSDQIDGNHKTECKIQITCQF